MRWDEAADKTAGREVLYDETQNSGPKLEAMAEEIVGEVRQAWAERVADHADETADQIHDAIQDRLHEIADGAVPIMNYAIAETCLEDWSNLMLDEPDCGPAFDGRNTPLNLMAGNLYDLAVRIAYAEARECREAMEDAALEADG